MKTALYFATLLCLIPGVRAQTPTATPAATAATTELPKGPLLRPAPEFSQWEITFSYPDDEHKKSKLAHKKAVPADLNARPKKVVTTKTGRIIHESQTDMLNRVSECWYDGGIQYSKSSQDSIWYQPEKSGADTSANPAHHPLPTTGYRDMDLVKKENYSGITSYDSRQCLIFTPGGFQTVNCNNAEEAKKKLKSIDDVAYIDADTRMPVAVRTSDDLRSFQFDPPPSEAQHLPADLTDQLKNGDDAHTRLNQPASRPY